MPRGFSCRLDGRQTLFWSFEDSKGAEDAARRRSPGFRFKGVGIFPGNLQLRLQTRSVLRGGAGFPAPR